MACEYCNNDLKSVTRAQNKTLRTVNRLLRRRQEQIQKETDETIAVLFEAPTAAELALRKIWEETGIDSCGPDDYEMIAEVVVGYHKLAAASANPTQ